MAGEPRPKRFAPAAAYAPAARERRRRAAPRARAAATRSRGASRRRAVRVLALSGLFLFFLPAVPVALLLHVPPLGSAMMVKRWVDARAEHRAFSLQYHWVPASQLPRSLREAVVASEDQRFYDHAGFDWKELRHALDEWREGGGLRGASTITQQVAKNLFLWPGRSLLRKVFEAWFTVWIEWLWPKERILEVYLNIAEMGDGVFGAEAASRRHFRHPAAKLVPHESALLAAMLPSPLRSNPAHPSAYLRARQRWILRQM
ncbi:MAG: monofunctional biosynthetic peptidoglycan transglycosylase [Myxococcota bacterium]